MREATHTTRCERAVRAVWEHARCAAGRAEGERPEDARIPGAERPALEAGPARTHLPTQPSVLKVGALMECDGVSRIRYKLANSKSHSTRTAYATTFTWVLVF